MERRSIEGVVLRGGNGSAISIHPLVGDVRIAGRLSHTGRTIQANVRVSSDLRDRTRVNNHDGIHGVSTASVGGNVVHRLGVHSHGGSGGPIEGTSFSSEFPDGVGRQTVGVDSKIRRLGEGQAFANIQLTIGDGASDDRFVINLDHNLDLLLTARRISSAVSRQLDGVTCDIHHLRNTIQLVGGRIEDEAGRQHATVNRQSSILNSEGDGVDRIEAANRLVEQ